MCGICGFIAKNEISIDELKAMNDTVTYRGPDDSGAQVFTAANRYVGLAQRRLAIIDLSEHGHQPMHSFDKNISLVFNGEIYNFQELRGELDYPFVSQCDTEVIIAAYLKWGIDCLSRFNGMFALALYDHRTDTLYLARDRVGKKPLYYWYYNGNIVFASTLKPIMAAPGFSCKIRQEVLPRYLYHGYIVEPDTIFEDTWKLEPGHFLRIKDGIAENKVWWNLIDIYHQKRKQQITDYTEAKEQLKEKLARAVRLRMIADVPVGTFLSGGYDSSLITAIAQSVSDKQVKTFCIGFNEKEMNEAVFAKAVAKHLGTDHVEMYISENEMLDMADSIPEYYDEPFADSSQIPTMLVSKLAKQEVTVAISGDGGDEFFCGYNVYDLMPAAQFFDIPGAVTHAVGKIPVPGGSRLTDYMPNRIKIIAENRDKETKTQFGGGNYEKEAIKIAGAGIPVRYPVETAINERNWQRRRMLLDMTHYLPGDILHKVDRASMKYSLETRCPLLDVDVIEYSFALKHSFKYNRGNKKRILKDIAYEYIPKQLLDRPKTGFGVPLSKWLRGALRDRLIAYSREETLNNQGIFNPNETQNFIDRFLAAADGGPASGANYFNMIWSFLVFQMWYDKYVNA